MESHFLFGFHGFPFLERQKQINNGAQDKRLVLRARCRSGRMVRKPERAARLRVTKLAPLSQGGDALHSSA
jgi:hypothetical protein